MTVLLFFIAVIAACLLWSTAWTAAAARAERPWLRRFLVAIAVAVPVVALLPWAIATAALAWGVRLETNWFGPTLTAALAALVGGVWIVRSGLSRSLGVPAAGWPLLGLAAAFLIAKLVAAGALLVMEHNVVSMARFQRVEAAALMQSALPPLARPADDAAPLYMRAFALIEADPSLAEADSLLQKTPHEVDARTDVAVDLLARHATTLDLLRRGADRSGCRFVRDWLRPSVSMVLPEIQSTRQASRLLALAIRQEAADGKRAEALGDIERLHRMALHVAGEPILVSGLVGVSIDAMAIDCLAEVLPLLTKADLAALDAAEFRDFVATPISFARHFLGEEAFGLATFADVIDPRSGTTVKGLEVISEEGPSPTSFPFLPVSHSFLMPADIAGYRAYMERFRELAAPLPSQSFPAIAEQTAVIEKDLLEGKRPGIFTALLAPALTGVLRAQATDQARHRAAEIAVAATRQRLETGALPESADALMPRFLPAVPRDPFTTDAAMRVTKTDDAWLVYSVGPNGRDDGGPVKPGDEKPADHDDVGLWLAR